MKKEIKKEVMDMVFLLDKSGSMSGIEKDTIGGYNSYLKNNKDKNIKVTTILFNNQYTIYNERKDISKVKDLTEKEYQVGGTTALLDALGTSINYMEEQKAKKVMFIITTDGLENSSKEFTKEKIKEMIETHKDWEFVYIGADIDSYKEGGNIGIKRTNIANYTKDKKGISNMFKSVNTISNMYMCEEYIDENWKKDLEKHN